MSLNPAKMPRLSDKLEQEEQALKAELEAVVKDKARVAKKEKSKG